MTASPIEMDRIQTASRWVTIMLAFALLFVLTGLYADVLAGMAQDWWNEPSLSQGLLIPPTALYFAWLKRKAILAEPAHKDPRGLALALAGCLMYIAGLVGAEFFLSRISFVVLCTAFIWIFWGMGRLRKLAFPLVLLAAMVPLPSILYNRLAAPLQLFASQTATSIAQTFGITVFRDGNIIELAHLSLGVEEACSGLTALSSMIMAALLIGQVRCRRRLAKILLLLAAMPIAIGVNVVRVAGTAILADQNPDIALGYYHMFSGWFVFILGLTSLYICAVLLDLVGPPRLDVAFPRGLNRKAVHGGEGSRQTGAVLLTVLLAMSALTGMATAASKHRPKESLAQPLESIEPVLGDWRVESTPTFAERSLSKLVPTELLSRTYRNSAGRRVGVLVTYYAAQSAGVGMHSPKDCLPGGGWEIWQYGSAVVPAGTSGVTVNRYSIQRGGQRAVVLYWYQSRDRLFASEYLGKVLLLRDAMLKNSTAAALVRLTVADQPGAVEDGIKLAAQLIPGLRRSFGE